MTRARLIAPITPALISENWVMTASASTTSELKSVALLHCFPTSVAPFVLTSSSLRRRSGNVQSVMTIFRVTDVSSEVQVEPGVAQAIKEHGRLDILVNNAGINTMKHRLNIDQFLLTESQRILNVDLPGLFW